MFSIQLGIGSSEQIIPYRFIFPALDWFKRFTRRQKPRPDVKRQGYFYEVRSKRTKVMVKICAGLPYEYDMTEENFERAFGVRH